MSLTRWNPYREQMLDGGLEMPSPRMWDMALDVSKTHEGYVVEAAIPGVKPEDIHVEIYGDVLTIVAQRRSYKALSRSIRLPVTVKTEDAEAVFENGVLTLSLPTLPPTSMKQIKVSDGRRINVNNIPTRAEPLKQFKDGLHKLIAPVKKLWN